MKTCSAAQYLLFGMTLVMNPIAAAAQIVAESRAGAQGPIVGQTQNGIPQVDITAPSGAGVSHNAYVQFDVPQPGVILNNSSAIVRTLQAGLITANPNLVPGQSAKIIVNEVVGDMPSELRGYLEVAGKPAEVVVANSNGIVADAAGFINTTRAILTTGATVLSQEGGLDGFDVQRGELVVRGAGLNTSNVDQLDLIARDVSADAMIHARTLNVVAGANRVKHETLAATPDGGVSPASEVHVDVSGRGGIYADRIALVATEAGIGVSNRGVLAAQEGGLRLTAEGRLILTGKTYANGDLALASRDGIDNTGTTSGAQSISVDTSADFYNSGVLDARRDLTVAARNLVSTGTLAQSGTGPMTITVGGLFDNSNGTLQTHGIDMHLTAASLVNDYGRISQAGTGTLHISSDELRNRGGTIASGGELGIHATKLLNAAGVLSAERQVDVDVHSLDNGEGGYAGADRVRLRVEHALDNRGGKVEASRELSVSGDEVLNQAGSFRAEQQAHFDVRSFDNSQQGYIGAETLRMTARDVLNNRNGAVEASDGLAIAAFDIVNDGGSLRNSGDGLLSIVADGWVSNTQGGRIDGKEAVRITSAVFDNTAGRLTGEQGGEGDIVLATGLLVNDRGVIDSNRDLDVAVTTMSGDGSITAGRDATIGMTSDYTHHGGSTLHANRDLMLTTHGNFTNRGQLEAVKALTVNARNIDNPLGSSLNAISTTVNATDTINNAGRLEGETLTTRSAALSNVGTVIGRTVTLSAGVIDNTGPSATIAGAHEVNLYASERFSNTGQATVFSLGDINLAADGLREGGTGGTATDHTNARGRLVNRTATVVNDQSTIEAQGNLEIAAGTLVNARPAPVVETLTTGVTTKLQRKRDKYTACATGNAVSNSTCSQAVWDFGYKVPRHATYGASQIVSASKGYDAVDRLLVVRTNGGQQAQESIYYNTMDEHGDGSITVSYWDGYDPHIHYDPATEYPTRSDGHKGYQRIEISRDTTTTTREDFATGIAPAAQLVAGGDITLTNVGSVENYHGAIAAGKSIWIGAGKYDAQVDSMVAQGPHGTTTVNNTGQTLYRHETQDIVSRYAWNKDIRHDVGLVPQVPVVLPPVAIGRTGGTIVANEAVGIHARDIHNTQLAAVVSPTGMTGRTPEAHPDAQHGRSGSGGARGAGGDETGLWQSVIAGNRALDLQLPTSGLYDIHLAPDHPYLIVTDPRLTSYMQFISSDYMLEQLGLNPQSAQKRLGDGLVEQQEIRHQITALTGRAHLPGYAGAQEEYRALMASGVRAARQFNLQSGIALTSAQMDALTSDIVWLVSQPVRLQGGGMTQVLVPIVYLTRTHAGDLRPDGAVIVGEDVELHALGDIANSGGIIGSSRTIVGAAGVRNRAGLIGEDGVTIVSAARDVINESGRITGKRVAVLAGRDIVNTTLVDARGRALRAGPAGALNEASSDTGRGGIGLDGRTASTVLGAQGTIASTGDMVVMAGRDLAVHGAEIRAGPERDTTLQVTAARDIVVDTIESTTSQSLTQNDRHHWEASNRSQQTSLIASGGDLTIHSGNDTTFKGARIGAGRDLDIHADGNLAATAVLDDARFDNVAADDGTRQEVSHWYQQQVVAATLSAGRHVTLVAGNAAGAGTADSSAGAAGDTAERTTQGTTRSITGSTAGGTAGSIPEGTTGSTRKAGKLRGNVTLTGSSVTAGASNGTSGGVTIVTDGNVTLDSARETHRLDTELSSRRGSFLSGTRQMDRLGRATSRAMGSTVSGDTVAIRAGNDLTVKGSQVVGMNDVAMSAGGNVDIVAAQDVVRDARRHELRRSGITATEGLGFSIGVSRQQDDGSEHAVVESGSRSAVGSVRGNVSIKSGGNVHIGGSDIVAGRSADDRADTGGHIDVRARNIWVDPAVDTVHGIASQKTSQYGMTAALGGLVGNALETTAQRLARTPPDEDPRLVALDKVQAAMSVHRSAQAARSAMKNAGDLATSQAKSPPVIKATAMLGGSSSRHEFERAATANAGSMLDAGERVLLVAEGGAGEGGIRISGSRIGAREVSLHAARDLVLQSAQDAVRHTSRHHSSRVSIGVGAAIGGTQNGFTLELAAGGSLGRGSGSRTTHVDTQISALDTLSMRSGRDVSLLGAQASAHAVDVDVGRNLTIASRQDTNTSRSGNVGAGLQASVCVPPFCYGQTVDGSAQASAQALKNDFTSVSQQSGIRAGEGGYRIEVGGHTQLDGGVIASTADADRNALSTDTFSYTKLRNVARHAGNRLGFRARGHAGQSVSGKANAASPPQKVEMAEGSSDSAFGPGGFSAAGTGRETVGTTYAAVSPGAILVRDDVATGQDSTVGLSRDPSWANDLVPDRFDAGKVFDDLAVQQQSGELGMHLAGAMDDAFASLAAEAKAGAEQAYQRAQAAGDTGAMAQARADAAAADRWSARWGEGGAARVTSHATAAALGAAISGGSVPGAAGGAVAGDIASETVSQAVGELPGGRLLANAAVGAVGAAAAALSGDLTSALSGANGALSADLYNRQLHSSETAKLAALKRGRSEAEQQRLNDAACALVHCSAGIPGHDPNRQALVDSERRGSRYAAEQDEIRAAGAFEGYGGLASFGDMLGRYQVPTRTVGAVHGVTGAAGAAAALGAGCTTIAICGFAATVATTSLDYSKAGFEQLISGAQMPTYGEQTLRSLGMSPNEAAASYGAANLATTLGRTLLVPRAPTPTLPVMPTSKP